MIFTLQTNRLALKPLVESDAKALFSLMSDPSLTTFLSWEPHTSEMQTMQVLKSLIDAQQADKSYHWGIFYDCQIIGIVSLINVIRRIRTWTVNRAEIAYWIGISYQGKGFATEAAAAVVDFGFEQLKLHKIIIAHAEKNEESKRICEKLNFKPYALEHDAFQKNETWHNLIWYEKITTNINEN